MIMHSMELSGIFFIILILLPSTVLNLIFHIVYYLSEDYFGVLTVSLYVFSTKAAFKSDRAIGVS